MVVDERKSLVTHSYPFHLCVCMYVKRKPAKEAVELHIQFTRSIIPFHSYRRTHAFKYTGPQLEVFYCTAVAYTWKCMAFSANWPAAVI